MSFYISTILLVQGWLVGVLINHLANVLPLNEPIGQVPFCKRTVIKAGPEFLSLQERDEDEVPREYCHTPRHPAAWSALIAYLSGNQTCPKCAQPIGLRSVVVEILTPTLFWYLSTQYPPSAYLGFLLLYTTILILLAVTDLEHRLIQNVVILPAILLALLGMFVTPHFSWQQGVLGGALGLIVFFLFERISRGGLGGGDVTLSAFIGLITGFPDVILYMVLGILLAGFGGAILLAMRRVTLKTYFPYGPFLMVAGWVVMVWNTQLYALLY